MMLMMDKIKQAGEFPGNRKYRRPVSRQAELARD